MYERVIRIEHYFIINLIKTLTQVRVTRKFHLTIQCRSFSSNFVNENFDILSGVNLKKKLKSDFTSISELSKFKFSGGRWPFNFCAACVIEHKFKTFFLILMLCKGAGGCKGGNNNESFNVYTSYN